MTEWTGSFRDSREINPLGTNPENSLTGVIYTVNAWRNDVLIIPGRYSKLRFWRDTEVADLSIEDKYIVKKPGILGHEIDEDIDNGFRPAGLFHMSSTTVQNVLMIQDYGANYDTGTAHHHLTMYKSKSGSLVFGAGTCQWSWGLDEHHDHDRPHLSNENNIRVDTDPMGTGLNIE